MATAAVPEVLAVPRGSLVVFRGAAGGLAEIDGLRDSLAAAIGHDEFVVVCLPDGVDLSVTHDPAAMAEMLGLVDRSDCGHYHCEHG